MVLKKTKEILLFIVCVKLAINLAIFKLQEEDAIKYYDADAHEIWGNIAHLWTNHYYC